MKNATETNSQIATKIKELRKEAGLLETIADAIESGDTGKLRRRVYLCMEAMDCNIDILKGRGVL